MFRYARNLQVLKPLIEHSKFCFISKLRAKCIILLGNGGAVSSSSGSYARYHNEPMNNIKTSYTEFGASMKKYTG